MNTTNVHCPFSFDIHNYRTFTPYHGTILNSFGIFAKFWEPGKVKTRLADSIGEIPAADIYYKFLRCTIENVASLTCRKVIGFTPESKAAEFQDIAPNWELVPQAQGDLGRRMQSYFENCFAHGDSHAVLIGSDTPTLPVSLVESAFKKLDNHDIVLGPSNDGGYYLIGINKIFLTKLPTIFSDINWSTSQVLAQTTEKLRQLKARWTLLETFNDIDAIDDLISLVDELKNNRSKTNETQNELLIAAGKIIQQLGEGGG